MATKKRGLGRGLDALLGSVPDGHRNVEELPADDRAALKEIPVAAIVAGRHQPRQHFDEAALAALADSIRSQGVLQPLLVRPAPRGLFELVAGERRWRAARAAGLEAVPAIVRNIDEQAAMAVGLVENIQRADLNALEEATALRKLIDDCGLTHAQAAEAVGRSRAAISNLLRLFDLPEDVQQRVRDGQLSFGHARALLAAPAERRSSLAQRVAALGLSVRQTEALATAPEKASEPAPAEHAAYKQLAQSLSQRVGLPVAVRSAKDGSGRLTIRFRSAEELEKLRRQLD